MAPQHQLPHSMRAVVCEAVGKPFVIKEVPTPQVTPGSVVVKVISAALAHNIRETITGGMFTFPTPMIPGARAIGRVAAVGSDATALEIGQLVLVEPFIRGRDDTHVEFLLGAFDGPSARSKKLAADSWRDGVYAEYARVPLENAYALDEKALCGSKADGGLGLDPDECHHIIIATVAYGGLRGIDLKAGETVIVAPATGNYSGAAVGAAVAMGAKVIAVSRNLEILKKIQGIYPRVKIFQPTGDVEKDTEALQQQFGPVDAYIDISPGSAGNSTHLRSCINAVRQYGRISLMGAVTNDIPLPNFMAVFKNLTIRGQYMYEREDVSRLIRMAESGVFKLGKDAGHEIVGRFDLDSFEKGLDCAEQNSKYGQLALLTP